MSQQEQGALSPKIRDLIEALNRQYHQDGAIRAEMEASEGNLARINSELAALRARITEREMELAHLGTPIPEEPFPEEEQLARAEKQRRILALRRDMPTVRLKESQAEIERLRREIDAAWLEFGIEQHRKALLDFEEAAVLLRDRFSDVMVLAAVFRTLRLAVPEVVVGDVSTHGAFINSMDPVWNRNNQPEGRAFYATLRAARAEVDQAKAEQVKEKQTA